MVNFAGVIFALLFTMFFVKIFSGAYNFALQEKAWNILQDRTERYVFLLSAFAGACLCYYLVSQNETVYTWDYRGYWTRCIINTELLLNKPILAILALGGSIFFSDYNYILPMLTVLPLKIAGLTFTRYVLVNYVCFLVPTFFILMSLIRTMTSRKYTLLFMFTVLCFSPFFLAMLRGYIDVACIIPASLSLLLLKDYDAASISRTQIKRDIYISALLLCSIMFRRYFVFYVEGYIFALIMLSAYLVWKDATSQQKITVIRNAIFNIIIIGLFAFAVMTLLFAPLLWRILKNSYSEMYSAYDSSLGMKTLRVVHTFGYFSLILSGLAVLLAFFTGRMKRYTYFCVVSVIISCLSFFYVQGMGMHHILIIAPQLFILSCIGLIQIVVLFKRRSARSLIAGIFISVMLIGAINSYLPKVRPFLKSVSSLFCQEWDALRRDDIPVLNEIANFLNSKTEGTDRCVYILSESGTFNMDTLDCLRLPYELHHLHNCLRTWAIDLRDGFPVNLLTANIVVTTKPIQGTQEIIKFPAEQIMDSTSPFGRHFRKNEREFTIDNGVKVYIYEKESEFEYEDLKYIADYFSSIYPRHERIFADRILNRSVFRKTKNTNNNSLSVNILRWIRKNRILTDEEILIITNKSLKELEVLLEIR